MRRRQLVICATVLITACSGGPEPADDSEAPPPRDEETAQDGAAASDACNQAFADAQAGDAELQTTLTACQDIATFRATAADYPELLDTEPSVWLAEACTEAGEDAGGNSALCNEVAGEQE